MRPEGCDDDNGRCRIAAGIVGYADLRFGDAVGELLDRALATAPDRFRGIRQCTLEHPDPAVWRYVPHPPPVGTMSHPQFRAGFGQLMTRNLTFYTAVFHHQLPDVAQLADESPETTIVLNHIGQVAGVVPGEGDRPDAFDESRRLLIDLARRPNVMCKVGGMGQPYFGFGFELRDVLPTCLELARAWRPWAETVIEAFGVGRCMMESNFPADRRSCDFVALWNALKHIVSAASAEEKKALFHDTAARVVHHRHLSAPALGGFPGDGAAAGSAGTLELEPRCATQPKIITGVLMQSAHRPAPQSRAGGQPPRPAGLLDVHALVVRGALQSPDVAAPDPMR